LIHGCKGQQSKGEKYMGLECHDASIVYVMFFSSFRNRDDVN
jgi:hypothetical protein